MSGLEDQLRQDRALRNAARAVIDADIEHLKADFSPPVLGSRLSDGAVEVFEQASSVADDNKGVLGALVAAIFIWFARNPILSLLDAETEENGEETEPEAPSHRSETEQ